MLAPAAGAVAVVALGIAVLALRRADVVERRAKQWLADGDSGGQSPSVAPTTPSTPSSAGSVSDLERRLRQLESSGTTSGLSRVAVVRYDAFDDLGGRLSFSAAIVDDAGRGLVMTAIHGRTETRTYLKQVPVTPASGQRELSPEESQAVSEAVAGSA